MLMFALEKDVTGRFLAGTSTTVRINGVPTVLTFDPRSNSVRFSGEDGPQVRKLIHAQDDGGLVHFAFATLDGAGVVIAPGPDGMSVTVRTAEGGGA